MEFVAHYKMKSKREQQLCKNLQPMDGECVWVKSIKILQLQYHHSSSKHVSVCNFIQIRFQDLACRVHFRTQTTLDDADSLALLHALGKGRASSSLMVLGMLHLVIGEPAPNCSSFCQSDS